MNPRVPSMQNLNTVLTVERPGTCSLRLRKAQLMQIVNFDAGMMGE